ncbi:hypothetical protein KY289_017106 [Solanum tuberosum]|nr:hypothetical protein KY289_017106 [Solanum tuberosum]
MEGCGDFVQCLLPDMSIKILSCLDDPADLIRVSAVSSSWRQFGGHGFKPWKQPLAEILELRVPHVYSDQDILVFGLLLL